MEHRNDKINQLIDRLDVLLKRQDDFSKEINNLRHELDILKTSESKVTASSETTEEKPSVSLAETAKSIAQEPAQTTSSARQPQTIHHSGITPPTPRSPQKPINLEKIIGENLINKIGIAITVIGVAIGAKYSIEHDLISPVTRIILGYLAGTALLVFGMKLKKNYENYSSVLVSGAMAIMYFITYAAYSFYGLFPQVIAFSFMVIITVFTVFAALTYNRQVIAHIGLVGAYAVPFLLSEESGNITILFSYTAIINVGILVIAFRKYWKPLYYAAFGLTWLMYISWFVSNYKDAEHFGLALIFLSVFFAIFYLTFLGYKLFEKEKFKTDDNLLLLLNTFIFYGIGYAILGANETAKHLLGLFTLCNAIIHFIVSAIIFRMKLYDKSLFYFVSGLVLVFITLAIPVQLDGKWVTLLWAGEAALMFWIGRTKNVPAYEKMSYPLMLLAFLSIIHDWANVYNTYTAGAPETWIMPLFNVNFLTSVLFITAFGFITILYQNKKYPTAILSPKEFSYIISFSIPAIFLLTLYYAFRMEIENYWNQLFTDSAVTIASADDEYSNTHWNYDLSRFGIIWTINYSLLFVSLLSFANISRVRNQLLGLINLGLNVLTIAVFLAGGLYVLSELRESYLEQTLSQYYHISAFNIGIRYVSFAFAGLALLACHRYLLQDYIKQDFTKSYDIVLHISVLWIASSELINWMDIADAARSYKLGLSILWGVYSLMLIALGIWKRKKHLRIAAIALFAVTLVKLFFYDISHLDTIAKTVVFVSLGFLLLIISFLYNKFRHIISGENEG